MEVKRGQSWANISESTVVCDLVSSMLGEASSEGMLGKAEKTGEDAVPGAHGEGTKGSRVGSRVDPSQIGVITFYSAQVAAIDEAVALPLTAS